MYHIFGKLINSERMTIELTEEKKDIIYEECKCLINKDQAKIRTVARVIGLIISSFSATELGKLHYRLLEMEKIRHLKDAKGNFDCSMPITIEMKEELNWWCSNIHSQIRLISRGNPEITIKTDASLLGWGAICTQDNIRIGGRWKEKEKINHINYLEMLAIYFALRSFVNIVKNKYVRILSDNTTAISYINNMGGIKYQNCNKLAVEIWEWCTERNIWLKCSHIPGKNNIEADKLSREFNDQVEWQLDHDIFLQICSKLGCPNVDLFASRLNAQVEVFCSWKQDPECSYVDAFSLNWKTFDYVYIFPPFSLMGLCIKKIQDDQARGIIIAPLWPTQTWFTGLMKSIVRNPLLIPRRKDLLLNPHKKEAHPLWEKMTLIACQVSGEPTEISDFQKQLPPLLWHHGEPVLKNSIKRSSKDGFSTALNGKLIQFHHL